jgi:glycosyltransferase involved in cell wall biosynthesis
MPLYNKEADVLHSINSVLNQTVADWELVIVDDGSTDKGPELVRSTGDHRIRVFGESNQGVSAARNKGIAEAKIDLIAFLDADDEWEPDYLETILRLRDKFSDCDVFATAYLFTRSDGQKRKAILRGIKSDETEFRMDNYFEVAIQSDPPLWTSAVAVSKKAINSVGGFPIGVTAGEDLLTWARLALKFKIAYCNVAKAYFWEPLEVSDRSGRVPQVPDVVGRELESLLKNDAVQKTSSLKAYIALWHEMRAIIFIKLNLRKQALDEINKVFMHKKIDLKLIILYLIVRMPFNMSMVLAAMKKTIDRCRVKKHEAES